MTKLTADDIDEAMSVPQVAKKLNVSKSTIYSLINDGKISYLMVEKQKRIRPEHLAEYIERCTVTAGVG